MQPCQIESPVPSIPISNKGSCKLHFTGMQFKIFYSIILSHSMLEELLFDSTIQQFNNNANNANNASDQCDQSRPTQCDPPRNALKILTTQTRHHLTLDPNRSSLDLGPPSDTVHSIHSVLFVCRYAASQSYHSATWLLLCS